MKTIEIDITTYIKHHPNLREYIYTKNTYGAYTWKYKRKTQMEAKHRHYRRAESAGIEVGRSQMGDSPEQHGHGGQK